MSEEIVFVVRFVLLAASALIIGSCLMLAYEYFRAAKNSVSVFAIEPAYILMFMLSYSFFVAYGTVNLVLALDYPEVALTWRVIPLGLALVTGLIALRKIATYRRSDKDPDLK